MTADGNNSPENYLVGKEKSSMLTELINKHVNKEAYILEIGSNVGRNLAYLYEEGYTDLFGIEINEAAIDLMAEKYPDAWLNSVVVHTPIEEAIKELNDEGFELIYTMATLEHIHPDSEWIFEHMARIIITNGILITIEDEVNDTSVHFKRNYQEVFEGLGLSQIQETNCKDIKGLDENFNARVFVK